MKYIITDKNEVVIGHDFHQNLASRAQIRGRVIAAGHVRFDGNEPIEVSCGSIGYGLQSKPADLEIIKRERDRLIDLE